MSFRAPPEAKSWRRHCLTGITSMLMESVFKDQMVQFLADRGLISKHKHAFILKKKKFHCLQSPRVPMRNCLVCLDCNSQTDVVYTDFTQTFDYIVMSELLVKLEMYDITGRLAKWISASLTKGTQSVVIDYCVSSEWALGSY
jgi:hypothetical protein